MCRQRQQTNGTKKVAVGDACLVYWTLWHQDLCAGKDTPPPQGWLMQVAASKAAPDNQRFVPESVTATQTFTSKIVLQFVVANEAELRKVSNINRLGRLTLPTVEVDDGDGGKEELFAFRRRPLPVSSKALHREHHRRVEGQEVACSELAVCWRFQEWRVNCRERRADNHGQGAAFFV